MKRRGNQEIFGTSFLDVISCGLGATIIMIILANNDESDSKPTEIILIPISSESEPLNFKLKNEVKELEINLNKLNIKKNKLNERLLKTNTETLKLENQIINIKENNSSELSQNNSPIKSIYSSGIPVGREYLIFIIDTSGSMQANWAIVMESIKSIINIHPKVKGLQILNDNGNYLIEGYKNKWIPDSDAARKRAITKLSNWQSLSNSSPAGGLEVALRTYGRRSNDISIYVLGDDFTGTSYEDVLNTINRWSPNKQNEEKNIIIHGIGFPWGIGDRFATLMREVAYQNNGVFIGLTYKKGPGTYSE